MGGMEKGRGREIDLVESVPVLDSPAPTTLRSPGITATKFLRERNSWYLDTTLPGQHRLAQTQLWTLPLQTDFETC